MTYNQKQKIMKTAKQLFSFRLNPDLIDKIRKLAFSQSRSLTGQIEYILNQYLKK